MKVWFFFSHNRFSGILNLEIYSLFFEKGEIAMLMPLNIDSALISLLDLIFTANLIPFIGLIFMLIFVCINPLFEKRQTKLFLAAIIVNLVLLAAISADYIFANIEGENIFIWRRVTSFMNFAACPVIPFLLFHIFRQDEKIRKPYYIPLIFNAILCCFSMFVNIVFFITEENHYERGVLFFVPFLTAIIYIVLLIVRPSARHVQSKRVERAFLLSIIALLVVCMFMEVAMGLHFLSWIGSALGLFLYYLLLTIHSYIVDPLTGTYNRLMYSRALSRLGEDAHYLVSLLDINDFKLVNDLHGHDAGDAFLIRFTDIVNRHLPSGSTLYRIGGDELTVISKTSDIVRFDAAIKDARAEAAAYDIRFACGSAIHMPGDELDAVLKRADDRMYEDKKQMKANS